MPTFAWRNEEIYAKRKSG